ncbi:cytidine deaminase domain protein [Dictyocaulus viviparus]|uniref:Cytidine deaminase domain protein n=1 Tax=Dictyocaulus viviparus TaxID=29172 RepID=A0A0D8XUM7_DICVI|nr:cytidine deaminase domain protein [Dictyocaulus viviparus]
MEVPLKAIPSTQKFSLLTDSMVHLVCCFSRGYSYVLVVADIIASLRRWPMSPWERSFRVYTTCLIDRWVPETIANRRISHPSYGRRYERYRRNAIIDGKRCHGARLLATNCENASYGGSICAERNAITTALSKGFRQFKVIAIGEHLKCYGGI